MFMTVQLVRQDFIFNVLLAGSGQPGVTGLSGHNGSEVVTS